MSIKAGELKKGLSVPSFQFSRSDDQPPTITGDKIASCHSRKKYEVMDLGIMHPEETPTACLRPGQVGWVGMYVEGPPAVVALEGSS